MSLKDKKSLYDRQTNGRLGNSIVGPEGTGPNPIDGNYFQPDNSTVSPFSVQKGLKSDQMVELLHKSVNTSTGNVYNPSNLDRPSVDIDSEPRKYEDKKPS
tara:strand:+ start:1175 stop:1477 length:303 start_codon:yes stop_codon:yes gene_type:complete